ncbi:ATP-binding protein [Carboxylicivirga taeanensis]|uniref:PAS domain-containing sensor histidine kinase n=1 Tax=Carboxylicivirga taeanensis TaxID=1416875 RepID=UPI003F6DFBD4
MGLDYTFKEVVSSFNAVKEEVIDFAYRVVVILVGPLYAYALYFGWADGVVTVLHSISLGGLLLIAVFKTKINLKVKVFFLLYVLLYGNLYSIYNLGLFGGAQYFMILIFGLTTFYLKRGLAIGINLFIVLYFFLFMHLYVSGKVQYYSSPHLLVQSEMVWVSDFMLTVLVIAVGGFAIRKTFMAYLKKVKEQHESSKRFYRILDHLPIPVATLKSNKEISYSNDAFYQYFGYGVKDISNFDHWLRYLYPDVDRRNQLQERFDNKIRNGFGTQKQMPIEYSNFVTRNGHLKSAEVHHTFLGDTAVCAFVDLTEQKKKRRLLIETMMQAEEKENKRIAQELHDGVGPLLSAAKIYAHTLIKTSVDENKSQMGNKLNGLIDGAIKELRNTINNVSPQILQNYGLVKATESFVNHIKLVSNVEFTLETQQLQISDPLIELAIYRALVELINNSIKYGSPGQISISFRDEGGALSVCYKDDGVGFDFERERSKGFGLTNIINRIDSIGGKIVFNSEKGSGVEVDITFQNTK